MIGLDKKERETNEDAQERLAFTETGPHIYKNNLKNYEFEKGSRD